MVRRKGDHYGTVKSHRIVAIEGEEEEGQGSGGPWATEATKPLHHCVGILRTINYQLPESRSLVCRGRGLF